MYPSNLSHPTLGEYWQILVAYGSTTSHRITIWVKTSPDNEIIASLEGNQDFDLNELRGEAKGWSRQTFHFQIPPFGDANSIETLKQILEDAGVKLVPYKFRDDLFHIPK